jgi:diaminohydroxyphosphoribosylaminopyrimidine deaminase / 5-amino-6-(5-phosphoribosylamino)uracil reductase
LSPLDSQRLHEALECAESAIGITEPNPRVGCVIGTEQGAVLGRGATQHAGGPHAEVMALRDAAAQGQAVAGATAWVTLEPCAHQGRTPPCCDALIAAGLKRVVVAVQDPFPQVAGAGIARMRAAGLQVVVASGPLAQAAWDLNVGFFSRVMRQRPWVRLKVAVSLDGFTALSNGDSQWITSEAARTDGHAWRRRASAVMTGVGTVLADDPRLDVRLVPSAWQPLKVVVDSRGRTPHTAKLMQPPAKVLLATALQPLPSDTLEDATATAQVQDGAVTGVERLHLPLAGSTRVDLHALMAALAQRGVNELHVEAGGVLNGALVQAGLVDEWLVYQAPKLLGSGHGMALLPPLKRLDEAWALTLIEARAVGEDLRLRFRPLGARFAL